MTFVITSVSGAVLTANDGVTVLGAVTTPGPPLPRQVSGRVIGIDTVHGQVYGDPILLGQDFDLLLLPGATVSFALGVTLKITPPHGASYPVDPSNMFTDGFVSLASAVLPSWPYLQISPGLYVLYRAASGEFGSIGPWTAVLTVGGQSYTFNFTVSPRIVRYQ